LIGKGLKTAHLAKSLFVYLPRPHNAGSLHQADYRTTLLPILNGRGDAVTRDFRLHYLFQKPLLFRRSMLGLLHVIHVMNMTLLELGKEVRRSFLLLVRSDLLQHLRAVAGNPDGYGSDPRPGHLQSSDRRRAIFARAHFVDVCRELVIRSAQPLAASLGQP